MTVLTVLVLLLPEGKKKVFLNAAQLKELAKPSNNNIDHTDTCGSVSGSGSSSSSNNSSGFLDAHKFWNDPLVAMGKKKYATSSDLSSTKAVEINYGNHHHHNNNSNNNNNSSNSITNPTKKNSKKDADGIQVQERDVKKIILVTILAACLSAVVVFCLILIISLSSSIDDDRIITDIDEGQDGDVNFDGGSAISEAFQEKAIKALSEQSGVDDILTLDINGIAQYNDNIPQFQALRWLDTDWQNSASVMSSSISTKLSSLDAEVSSSLESVLSDNRLVQRYALLVLYFSTEGNYWNLKGSKSTSPKDIIQFPHPQVHECEWAGVTCNKNYMVSQLDLSESNLTGILPREIGWLSNLQKLMLEGNNISGPFPDNFFDKLRRLNWFDISFNDMTGTIPPELWTRPIIQYIYLNNNHFKGTIRCSHDDENEIPVDTQDVDSSPQASPSMILRQIWLQENELTGTIPSWLNLPLQQLLLSSNRLTGTVPQFDSRDISYVDLSSNYLEGPIPLSLFRSKSLYLNNNSFSGQLPDANALNEAIGTTVPEQLETLNLNANQLTGPIPDDFGKKWLLLDELLLQDNQITGRIPCWFPVSKLEVDCNISCNCCTQCF